MEKPLLTLMKPTPSAGVGVELDAAGGLTDGKLAHWSKRKIKWS